MDCIPSAFSLPLGYRKQLSRCLLYRTEGIKARSNLLNVSLILPYFSIMNCPAPEEHSWLLSGKIASSSRVFPLTVVSSSLRPYVELIRLEKVCTLFPLTTTISEAKSHTANGNRSYVLAFR